MKRTLKNILACIIVAAFAVSMIGGFSFAEEAAEVEKVTITVTTTFSETEFAGQYITFMKNYLEEKSGGNMTLDIFFGGTLAGPAEELSFVQDGSVDASYLNQNNYTNVFPLLSFPGQAYGEDGFQASVDLYNFMMTENEVTAPLIKAQIEANGVHMMGCFPAGVNSFVSKTECKTLEDLTKLKLGAGINMSAYQELGFNVVSIMPPEYYDSLSRGIVDVGNMPVGVLVSMSIQEVAPYFVMDGSYTAGNFFTINLDKWNSLSPAAQALLEETVMAAQEYAVELAKEQTADAAATIEAAGGFLIDLPEEDQARVKEVYFDYAVMDARNYAETAGCQEDMETVLQIVSEYQGMELK